MKISYSFGVMDLFHYGHLKALKLASINADLHVVGLLSDNASRAWLGEIVSSEQERRAVVESLSCVNFVMDQETLDPTDNLKKLHYIYPDATISVYRGDNITSAPARDFLHSIGGEIKNFDYYLKFSPTEILNVLNKRTEPQICRNSIISTKANTLLALQGMVKTASIEDILIVSVGELTNTPHSVFDKIHNHFFNKKIVVRSSSQGEDNFVSSNAGHYESILGVNPDNEQEVLDALYKVKNSYCKDGEVAPNEQILIQTQSDNIKYSGVVFTRDIQKNRPYYVINYDDSGLTDTVTGGDKATSSLWIASDISYDDIPKEWKSLFSTIKELERILSGMLLDIEFGVKKDNSIIIFQVRPLAASYKFGRDCNVNNYLVAKNKLKEQYKNFLQNESLQYFSDMAFWNPAEIIGDNPKTLDYSLYRDIITHRAWNQGLVPLGYRKVEHDLMFRFANKPYISLEYSFDSLVPSSLPNGIFNKLKDYYKNKFRTNPELHDKIEFDIVLSCFDFDLSDKLKKLVSEGFESSELSLIENSLKNMTENIIKKHKKFFDEDYLSLSNLEELRIATEKKLDNSTERTDPNFCLNCVSAIKTLVNGLVDLGTPQFARQARLAFIAKSLLITLLKRGYITTSVHDHFMSSISTIAEEFNNELSLYTEGKISLDSLKSKYGHLRAGTYDITSPRYDHTDFFENVKIANHNSTVSEETLCLSSNMLNQLKNGINLALKDNNINISSDDFLEFCQSSISQREYFKFIFTRTLSSIIEIIASIGEKLNFSRHDIAYFDITEILSLELYGTEERMSEFLNELFQIRKIHFQTNSQLILPNVILKESDFDFISISSEKPNFITSCSVSGSIVLLDSDGDKNNKTMLDGKIVVIEKADPGFDWIFTCNILGLVTKYGGVASHMAIRCAEFGIPAAIGCGTNIYNYVKNCEKITIDCKQGTLKSCN